jgi:hypothetical protein
MERLAAEGSFAPPRLASLEAVADAAIGDPRGRVLVDLWDVERLFDCAACGPRRAARLGEMNLAQARLPAVLCDACGR